MKYSLRSLMIVAILGALAAWFGRVQYLNRYAVFHDREAAKILNLKRPRSEAENQELQYHDRMARKYRRAFNVPWAIVNESP
jgi:hypothetical protein